MERLTEYHGGVAVIKDKSRLKEAMERLAEYENTGLTPEKLVEIDEAYTQQAKELMEYKQLEEQGFILRMHCKVGDTVRYTDKYESFEFVVGKILIDEQEVCIFDNESRGCVVCASNFDKHCKVVAEAKLEELR